jgi:hypothetical protein
VRFLALLLALVYLIEASAQCPNGRCPNPSISSQSVQAKSGYSWLADPNGSDQHYLFLGPTHVGTFFAQSGNYQRITPSGVWPIEEPPIPAPLKTTQPKPYTPTVIGKTLPVAYAEASMEEQGPFPREVPPDLPEWMTHGVDKEKIDPEKEYQINGHDVSRDKAFGTMAGTLTDDRNKRFVTVVGDKAFIEEFNKLWAAMPATVKDAVHCQKYAKSNYAVSLGGFADGVSIQDVPDKEGKGKVLGRFRTVPTAQQLTEAIRRADPNYKPEADPDPTKPATPSAPSLGGIALNSPAVLIGGVIAFAIFLFRTRK